MESFYSCCRTVSEHTGHLQIDFKNNNLIICAQPPLKLEFIRFSFQNEMNSLFMVPAVQFDQASNAPASPFSTLTAAVRASKHQFKYLLLLFDRRASFPE